MPIIIDGWNLIRNSRSPINDDNGDSLEAAMTLIAYLDDFQKEHQDPIVVVFDSSNEFLDIDYHNTPKLRIVPARDADLYIKSYIEKVPEKQRRNVRVVSSDNDVYYHAKSYSATPLSSEEFWSKLGAGY